MDDINCENNNLEDNNLTELSEINILDDKIESVKEIVKTEIQKTTNISKMRVADLRALILEKEIMTDLDELNKIKRDTLIKLLQEKHN